MAVAWLLAFCPAISRAVEIPALPFVDLSSEDFKKREEAQGELLAWARRQPDVAMDVLYRQSRTADDPEVRERCLAVLRELVNDEYFKEGDGYVGIRMRDEVAVVPGDPKARGVIRVVQVVRNSAAEQAGLQINDLIVGLNELVWHEGSASLPFSEAIRKLKPNSKIVLTVLRDGNLMKLEVTLGRRPLVADNPFLEQRPADIEAAERADRDAYFRRWLERRKRLQ